MGAEELRPVSASSSSGSIPGFLNLKADQFSSLAVIFARSGRPNQNRTPIAKLRIGCHKMAVVFGAVEHESDFQNAIRFPNGAPGGLPAAPNAIFQFLVVLVKSALCCLI
jgi:hypothetical protein